jgi:hypothetical protein
MGCGALYPEEIIEPVLADAEPELEPIETASDNLSEAPAPRTTTPREHGATHHDAAEPVASDNLSEASARTIKPPSPPALIRNVLPFRGGTDHNPFAEPDWLVEDHPPR